MGYYTRVTGRVEIVPPLTWAEIKDSPYRNPAERGAEWKDVKLNVVEEEAETDEGVMIRRYADAVTAVTDDSFKAYNIEEHLADLVRHHGAGHALNGALEGHGEQQGDMWRLVVRDGKVVRQVPKMVWPEG